jgi:hypothetical protein
MRIGFNEKVEAGGLAYHVQTEDVSDRDEIVSQVFLDGRVLHTYRVSYADWKAEEGWEARVSEQAKRQHALMVAATQRGRISATPQTEGS